MLDPNDCPGTQEKVPVPGSNDAPGGMPDADNLRGSGGRSGSVAITVKVSRVPGSTVCEFGTDNTGGWLTSLTVMLTLFTSVSEPSETWKVAMKSPGPGASVGVQENIPLAASKRAPAGKDIAEKVNFSGGRSGSEAVTLKLSIVILLTNTRPGTWRDGGMLASFTWIETVLMSENAGEPLSVARKMTR